MKHHPSSLFPFLFLFCLFGVFLSGCGTAPAPERETLVLKPARYAALPGWEADDHAAALAALSRSCDRILKRGPDRQFGPDPAMGTYGDWQPVCRALAASPDTDAQAFFERHFAPWAVTTKRRKDTGLFTGYYEAALEGSMTRHGPYQYPLYERPEDLVMVDLGEFRDSLKGQRIAGRVKHGRLRPYEDRPAIERGVAEGAGRDVLVWVDDPVDAFFLHIQGSGLVRLDDGRMMRVGYAGQNGHPYFAIGRALVHEGILEKDDVSMQAIRDWLEENPGRADEIMNMNKSYVFFRALETDGPIGAEGLALTAGRSLAVDHTYLPYGAPVWLDAAPPADGMRPIRRLMVAQDTGGAIRGAVRGDVFWGYGPEAESLAGAMKSKGRYWILLPAHMRPMKLAARF